MKIYLVALVLVSFVGLSSCSRVPAKSVFSIDWVRYSKTHLVSSTNFKTKEEERIYVQKKNYEALNLYQSKKYDEAVSIYSDSLLQYSEFKDYYIFGCCLDSVNRIDDAIKAYTIAIETGGENDKFINYNISCCYMKKFEFDNGLKYLEKAIKLGYEYENIFSDSDYTNFRNQENWKETFLKFIARVKKNNSNNNSEQINNEVKLTAFGKEIDKMNGHCIVTNTEKDSATTSVVTQFDDKLFVEMLINIKQWYNPPHDTVEIHSDKTYEVWTVDESSPRMINYGCFEVINNRMYMIDKNDVVYESEIQFHISDFHNGKPSVTIKMPQNKVVNLLVL